MLSICTFGAMDYYLLQTAITLLVSLLLAFHISLRRRRRVTLLLPPGNSGLPFIGETLSLLYHKFNNDLPSFFVLRFHKYGPIFSTRILLGGTSVISNTPSFHRLLFTNENTLLHTTWPPPVYAILGEHSLIAKTGAESKRLRSAIMTFLVPSSLQRYVGRVDAIAVKHLEQHWDGKDVVGVYELMKQFVFAVISDLFLSASEEVQEEELLQPFNAVMTGLLRLPITLPWSYRAKKAAKLLKQRFRLWIEKTRREEEETRSEDKDLLSCLINYRDKDGKLLRDEEIEDNVLTLLMASHHTTRSLLTLLVKYLADYKWCYHEVLREQLGIKNAKRTGELLNWGDLQGMQYSWWVIQETLRVQPILGPAWRNATQDIEHEGYIIPKGCKLFWSSNSHYDRHFFPSPDKFDPSRFSCTPIPYTFIPFGGGPRMCPGNELAKMVTLVFLHHVVTRYEWTLLNPHERLIIDPVAVPSHGLHINVSPSILHRRGPP